MDGGERELWELSCWLRAQVDVSIRRTTYRKSVWTNALDVCSRMQADDGA